MTIRDRNRGRRGVSANGGRFPAKGGESGTGRRLKPGRGARGHPRRLAPPTCPAEAHCRDLREGGSSPIRATAGGRWRGRRSPALVAQPFTAAWLSPRQRRLANLGDDGEVGIDDVGD